MQVRFLGKPVIWLALIVFIFIASETQPVRAQIQEHIQVDQFDLMTAASGWVLVKKHLFWTFDTGRKWHETGPDIPSDASIQDVKFIDSNKGWVLWTTAHSAGSTNFELAQTSDNGNTWTVRVLPLFESGEVASYAQKVMMGWFDSQTGWIAVKQHSGSNFSLGTLFTTSDGGGNWVRHNLPIADTIYFSNPQNGWAVGGPKGDQIFTTRDGGANWELISPALIPDRTQAKVYTPFISSGAGLLVMTTLGEQNSLNLYSLKNYPDQWSLAGQVELNTQPGMIGLSIIDSRNAVATIPGTNTIVRLENGKPQILENQDGRTAAIVDLDMVSLDLGWAKEVDSNCLSDSRADPGTASVSCSSTTRLLNTHDGGLTWQAIDLPIVEADESTLAGNSVHNSLSTELITSGNTEIFIGQGFDRCEIPTVSQMQTWADSSPYKAVNLYIGGSSRACDNISLISSYIFQLYQQGWKFFPTWVGPQAPCTSFGSRISSDVTAAYGQGVNEANLAVDRLGELGLTDPNQTGSVIYYDIEHYGTNTACRAAVNAFMNGWVAQIHARGNIAGVYASTLCNTGLSDFRSISNVPDVIWPARWYHNLGQGYYDPTADVWDLGSCIPNTAWPNHQRIRQYEGDHYETWGDLTMDIDSDVLDGVVAIPYGYPQVSSITRLDSNPTSASSVRFKVTFSKSVTGVKTSAPFKDFGLTSDVTGATITGVSGSGSVYTVTVSTGTGAGTIRLDVLDYDSIKDANNNPLGGAGWANGNYTSGELYTIFDSIFFDVPNTYWAWSYIERLYNAGVTGGCGTSPLIYCPTTIVTRDQMAIFLLRGKYGSSYVPPAATGVFQDVPADYWAASWIEQLAVEGITSGCSATPKLYCPTTAVTRDQMAVFLLRAMHGLNYVPPKATGVFLDVPTDYWAADWIDELATEGITGGCGNGNYCPTTPVTRDQMAVFLMKSFNLP